MEREKLIRIARGDKPAAVLLKNANLVNVFTGEVYLTDIAIRRSRIVGLGDGYEAEQVIDLDGKYVAPGYIETDMVAAVPEKAIEKIVSGIPLRRLGQPDEVARVVEFLADPESEYITGQVYSVNGGLHM